QGQQAEHLGMGEAPEENRGCCALSEYLVDEAVDAVEREISEKYLAGLVRTAAPAVEEHEEDQVHRRSVELGGMARLGELMRALVDHEPRSPRQGAGGTVAAAVEEAANPPDRVAQRKPRGADICKFQKA